MFKTNPQPQFDFADVVLLFVTETIYNGSLISQGVETTIPGPGYQIRMNPHNADYRVAVFGAGGL